jgi:hypothetical protein
MGMSSLLLKQDVYKVSGFVNICQDMYTNLSLLLGVVFFTAPKIMKTIEVNKYYHAMNNNLEKRS